MGTGIIGEECQAIRIRDYTGQHMSDGYATIGTGSGEGLSVIGGELVGVYRGINHARTSPTAGSHIANIHINAYYRCIILNNILDMNVHDCLLYKTHVSFEDWQGIELVGCYQCDVHDNQIACPGVGTTGGGTQLGITGVNSTDNKIHHNQFAQWPSSGGQGVFMTTGCARNLVSDNSRSFNEGSPDPVVYFTGADKSNIARNNQPMATQTFAASDATPSVGNALHDFFSTANTSSTTITAFDDGYSGQRITVMMNDLYTGFTNNPGLLLKNGANVAVGAGAGCTISFIFDGQNARWIETSRGF
jgi:hypothetical protein